MMTPLPRIDADVRRETKSLGGPNDSNPLATGSTACRAARASAIVS